MLCYSVMPSVTLYNGCSLSLPLSVSTQLHVFVSLPLPTSLSLCLPLSTCCWLSARLCLPLFCLPAAAECLCSCSVCREAKTFERAQPVVNFECVCGFTGGTKSALDRHLARYPGSDFNEQVQSRSVPCSLSASPIVL